MMSRRLALYLTMGLLAMSPGWLPAQELLTNGGLELVFPDTGGFDSVPPGWQIEEGPRVPWVPGPYIGDYNESGVTTLPCPSGGRCRAVDAADYTVWRDNLGKTLAADGYQLPNEGATTGVVSIADYNQWKLHYNDPFSLSLAEPGNFSNLILEGDWHMWFQPYHGSFAEAEDNFIHMTQTVPGTAGLNYMMKGWALFEDFFAGARANLNLAGSNTSPPDDGAPSPTDTFFALEFLDAGGNVLDGSVVSELMAAGQLPDTNWKEHTLSAMAPAGTTNVRVRVSMIDGVINPDADPQSFFVDAFSLTSSAGSGAGNAVPEPSSWIVGCLAFVAASRVRRRS
jgi:hypothetical protein